MISAAFPGFLAAGAFFAAVPLVLHLLARRPPERTPLPTARFLQEDRRTLLRLTNRPSDVSLLVVRGLFALALGAAFAGLAWAPERSGTVRTILVDVEAAADIGLDSLSALTRMALSDAEEDGLDGRVLAYARDENGELLTSDRLSDLEPAIGAPAATALDGLSLLRSPGVGTAIDSVEVTWILRPTWRIWTRGIGLLREALWPGSATVLPVEESAATEPTADAGGPLQRSVSVQGFPPGAALHRALDALYLESIEPEPGTAPGADLFFAERVSADDLAALAQQARAGSTVVLSGALPSPLARDIVPWDPRADSGSDESDARVTTRDASTPTTRDPGSLEVLLPGEAGLAIRAAREPGAPPPGSRIVAVFDDTHPAVAAGRVGAGCIVYAALSLRDAAATGSPAFVELVADLAAGCGADAPDGSLDSGGLAALERSDLPNRIAVADLGSDAGTPLAPALLVIALLLLGAETLLTRRPSK